MTIHCENGMCGICDGCRAEDPVRLVHVPPPEGEAARIKELEQALDDANARADRYADTIAWQSRQLDEALARAERSEAAWKRSQADAEELGRRIAMRPVGVP